VADSLEALVEQFLERRERGEALDAETFARAHPEHAEGLRAALAALPGIEARMDAVRELLPARIGPFAVRRQIARGGMGRVLEVVDTRSGGPPLALKLLDGAASLGERGRERFAREARVLQGLDHPGVVRVVAAGADDPVPWLAMELVAGETLAARLARARASDAPAPRIPLAEAAEIAAHLARALAAVHASGLVHRDVKPANVIRTPEGRVVLVDFGMVRDEASHTLTATGDVLGTPQYMAPEQARGERADAATDVWGAGAVLYELLTLEPPHRSASQSAEPLQMLERARRCPVPPARRFAPHVPRELEWIAAGALAFRRGRRTPTAARLAEDLEDWLAGRPARTRAPGPLARLEDGLRVHGRSVWAGCLAFALLAAGTFAMRAAHGRRGAEQRREVEAALADWLADDGVAARARVERLGELRSRVEFAGLLSDLIAGEPPVPTGAPAQQAAALGWRAVDEGRVDEGLAELQRARELAPQSPVPLLLLARAAERTGRSDLAAREYRAAVELLPQCAAVHARLANVHYARKDDAESERSIRTALELEPERAAHHFVLARVLSRRKQREAGLAAALRGAELAGDGATASQLQILATLLDDAERFGEAQAVLLRTLELVPGDGRVLHNLAISYMADHRYHDAIATCRRIESDPHRAQARASEAWMRAGSNVATCETCQALYREHPDLLDPDAAEDLALQALDGEFENSVPLVCAQVAQLTGRRDALRDRLLELQESATEDSRIAALERALRLLR
jgi:Flp pilus assembly protein TadD